MFIRPIFREFDVRLDSELIMSLDTQFALYCSTSNV